MRIALGSPNIVFRAKPVEQTPVTQATTSAEARLPLVHLAPPHIHLIVWITVRQVHVHPHLLLWVEPAPILTNVLQIVVSTQQRKLINNKRNVLIWIFIRGSTNVSIKCLVNGMLWQHQ